MRTRLSMIRRMSRMVYNIAGGPGRRNIGCKP
jgi:hypothetical protein